MKEKQQIEEHQQMKKHNIKNKQQQQHKNVTGGSPKQGTVADSF